MVFNLTQTDISKVDENSEMIDTLVSDIITPYCKDLDKYVSFIRSCLSDGMNPPTNDELDDFCMNLSTLLYFASAMSENLGIRDDISKALYKEAYNNARDEISQGTVADKNSIAELKSQQEMLVNVCYSRAYKQMKAKVEFAQELLSSCKKVLTRRINEQELTKVGVR